jgi:hypothetical protein
MAKDKSIFYSLNEFNTKQIFVGDDNDHLNDVLCVPSLSCNLILVYQNTYSSEGNTIEFSPHQVVIDDKTS